jgi:hypothetical protein
VCELRIGVAGGRAGDDVRVQEQAVGLLQNLCKATAGVKQVSTSELGWCYSHIALARMSWM